MGSNETKQQQKKLKLINFIKILNATPIRLEYMYSFYFSFFLN